MVCECGGGSRERNDTRRESVFDGDFGGYVRGDCRFVVCVRFRSLSADARVGMMTLKSVCGACLWGDVTWNRVGSIEAEIRFIGGFNLRVPFPLLNGSFQKQRLLPLVAQIKFTMVTHCRCPSLQAHKNVLSYSP